MAAPPFIPHPIILEKAIQIGPIIDNTGLKCKFGAAGFGL
jgi:hypothetical protein